MTLKDVLIARSAIGAAKKAAVLDMTTPKAVAHIARARAQVVANHWPEIKDRLRKATERGARNCTYVIQPDFIRYSVPLKAQADEIVRLAVAEELTAVLREAPRSDGAVDLVVDLSW